jgi:hypothetical protein
MNWELQNVPLYDIENECYYRNKSEQAKRYREYRGKQGLDNYPQAIREFFEDNNKDIKL